MQISLAENIRAYRKQRSLTREQLAEALGVTAGAVYKWENGLSVPELEMILELADFFDTSVDVLLGYSLRDNRLEAAVERLERYFRTMPPEALPEAEKALRKYPNSFLITLYAAGLYLTAGIGENGRAHSLRALELLEKSLQLVSQNTNPEISELTIYGMMAQVHMQLGEREKGVELLKKHNVSGMFSGEIGAELAVFQNKPEEAEPYLASSLIQSISAALNAVTGYAFVSIRRGDYSRAEDILLWGLNTVEGASEEGPAAFPEKVRALIYALLAGTWQKAGKVREAREAWKKAAELAARFDASPDYDLSFSRFTGAQYQASGHDTLGTTAAESIDSCFRLLDDPELRAVWEEAKRNGYEK